MNDILAEESSSCFLGSLREMLEDVSGMDSDTIDVDETWFSLGLDSLILAQLIEKISVKHKIKIEMNDLLISLDNIRKLADHLSTQLPTEGIEIASFTESTSFEESSQKYDRADLLDSIALTNQKLETISPDLIKQSPLNLTQETAFSSNHIDELNLSSNYRVSDKNRLELIRLQSELMEKQLKLLQKNSQRHLSGINHIVDKEAKLSKTNIASNVSNNENRSPWTKESLKSQWRDNPAENQLIWINSFKRRFLDKTKNSKSFNTTSSKIIITETYTSKKINKLEEIAYPIVFEKSSGANLWDLDGNHYVDFSSALENCILGHNPPVVQTALKDQIENNFSSLCCSQLRNKVAEQICDFGDFEKVHFCKSTPDALLTSLKIAQLAKGKSDLAHFADPNSRIGNTLCTHDISDRNQNNLELIYGSQESLEILKREGHRIAAVLVEPIQISRFGSSPESYLEELRKLTQEIDAVLVFDETRTGIRTHQGGSQVLFNLKADLVVWGSAISNGIPIAVIGGKKQYFDVLFQAETSDVHHQIGEKNTLSKFSEVVHPFALAASRSVLSCLKEAGPKLIEDINNKTRFIADTANAYFIENNFPIRVKYFGSLFSFESFGMYDPALYPVELDLFYNLLIEQGFFLGDQQPLYVSTGHSQEHIENFVFAIKKSANEIREVGFSFATDPKPGKCQLISKGYYPLLPAQSKYYMLSQLPDLEKASHLSLALTVKGDLNIEKIEQIFSQIVERHQAFRTEFAIIDGQIGQKVNDSAKISVNFVKAETNDVDKIIKESIRFFDLTKAPLIRIEIFELDTASFLIVLDAHHIIFDGDSANILISEFIKLYHDELVKPVKFSYVENLFLFQEYLNSENCKVDEAYWRKQFTSDIPALDLPTDYPRLTQKDFRGETIRLCVDEEATKQLKTLARETDTTLFITLLASVKILLSKLSQQTDIVVGVPVSLRDQHDLINAAGYFTNIIPLCSKPQDDKSFQSFVKEVKKDWFEGYVHKKYPYESLVESLDITPPSGRNALFDVMFIYENTNSRHIELNGLVCCLYQYDPGISNFDLTIEALELNNSLSINITYSKALFKMETVEKWRDYLKQVFNEISDDKGLLLSQVMENEQIEKSILEPSTLDEVSRDSDLSVQTPKNELEQKILEIWKRTLKTDNIGTNDSFFRLGGRSLETIRLISQINDVLKTSVSPTAIFKYQTIAQLARHIENGSRNEATIHESPIIPAKKRDQYELSNPQFRFWLNTLTNSTDGMEFGVDITGDIITFHGDLDIDIMKEAVRLLTERHGIFRTTYGEKEGIPYQKIYEFMEIPISYEDISTESKSINNDLISEKILEEFKKKFDLNSGPLIRFSFWKTDESKTVMFCNGVHISFDGWSFSIVLQELAMLYNALKQGKTGTDLPLVMQYVDYVEWIRQGIENGVFKEQEDYWKDYLNQKKLITRLTKDYETEDEKQDSSKILQLLLDEEITERINQIASTENTTPYIVMFSLLNIWLANLTNQRSITIGTVFTGRTRQELEKIPGIMMNTVPITIDINKSHSCKEILQHAKDKVWEVYQNQDYPLDLILRESKSSIDMNKDLYSVVFIGQEFLEGLAEFDGLKTTHLPILDYLTDNNGEQFQLFDFDYEFPHDIKIEMVEQKNKIKLLVGYDKKQFCIKSITQYFNHFINLLEEFTLSPNMSLSQFPQLELIQVDDLF